ncbi:MAG: GGDEF domain-containing protein [Hespellia sp.]|nr:GGDEF domain-containing protein [Hespellia sp.]
MKKMNFYKTIQLILFIIITLLSLFLILLDPDTRSFVAKNSHILVICVMLWITLVLAFVFLFLDFYLFSHFRRNVKQLNQIAHADSIAGIPNRFSCDSLIEKYIGSPLPPNMGCIMIDLTNIIEINKIAGRKEGDRAIRLFSDTLHLAAAGQCFIGRNGGNKFIALFENCREDQLRTFMERFNDQINQVNAKEVITPIEYKYGAAFHSSDPAEALVGITDLIAHANNRIYKKPHR